MKGGSKKKGVRADYYSLHSTVVREDNQSRFLVLSLLVSLIEQWRTSPLIEIF